MSYYLNCSFRWAYIIIYLIYSFIVGWDYIKMEYKIIRFFKDKNKWFGWYLLRCCAYGVRCGKFKESFNLFLFVVKYRLNRMSKKDWKLLHEIEDIIGIWGI